MQTVEFAIWPARNKRLGVIKLQNPKALNSLTLEMVQQIALTLGKWAKDPEIAAVIFYSDLAKAFCAGGDVKTVVLKLRDSDPEGYAADFFKWEYKMDYLIQTFPKPILVRGDGIVMGGGMGIFCGASHGVLTERSVMAMPEIAIGFFPDVGAGYFLNQIPREEAVFLAWTGARVSPSYALRLGFAKAVCNSNSRGEVFKSLRDIEWTENADKNRSCLSAALARFSFVPEDATLEKTRELVRAIFHGRDPSMIARRFSELNTEDPWLLAAQKEFQYGSPLSKLVSFAQLERAENLPLLDIFVMEWSLARHMGDRHDFKEGVRARLIDKDNRPRWIYPDLEAVPQEEVDAHFVPYSGENLLRQFFEGRIER